jgi:hypothetical protein
MLLLSLRLEKTFQDILGTPPLIDFQLVPEVWVDSVQDHPNVGLTDPQNSSLYL